MMPRSFVRQAASGVLLCCLGSLYCTGASARRTPFTAFAQTTFSTLFKSSTASVFPQHTTTAPTSEVEMKPDLKATQFSAQNAFYFASLSKIAYKPEREARGLVKGNSTCEGLGFDKFYWFEAGAEAKESFFDAIHDTEAFVAANDEMIAVVFRGTKEQDDWATNLNASPRDVSEGWGVDNFGSVHEGFDDGINTVWDSRKMHMHRVIRDLCGEPGKDRKLFIAGHSLGGALATIAAARLAIQDDLDIAGVYTIGSPKVFDQTGAEHFDNWKNQGTAMKKKYFRCRNNNDIVPRVPAALTHVGTEIYLDRFGAISTASLPDRILGRVSALSRGELIDGINDHGSSEYVRHFQQVVINSPVPLGEKAASVLNDALGNLILMVAPDEFAQKYRRLEKLKKVKSVVEEVKERAKEDAAREAALDF